jgi:hypothetical protein
MLRHCAPEHYLTIAGLICVYARPFTHDDPVGKLPKEIVPEEFKELHGHIMTLRHQLFAHGDASLTVGKDDYPNETVIENDGQNIAIAVSRAAFKPTFLERMLPLVEALIEKTYYHRLKLSRKLSKTVRVSLFRAVSLAFAALTAPGTSSDSGQFCFAHCRLLE